MNIRYKHTNMGNEDSFDLYTNLTSQAVPHVHCHILCEQFTPTAQILFIHVKHSSHK